MTSNDKVSSNTLFDDIERNYLGVAQYSESIFVYLNRSARSSVKEIRLLLECWFSHYPQQNATDLRKRFRSTNDKHHQSAFFELFIHELLLGLKLNPEIHPELEIKNHPDFFIKSNKQDFYLEAVIASNVSDDEYTAHSRMNVIYNSINRLNSPNFFIGINVKSFPNKPIPAGRIRSFLTKQLESLAFDEIEETFKTNFDDLPQWQYKQDNWEIEFFPIPKSPKSRGKEGIRPIGMQFHDIHFIDSRTPIRDTLCNKAGHYGKLDIPYVVAINALDGSVDDIDIMEALFGQEKYLIDLSIKKIHEPKMIREHDGVWTGKAGPRYTRLSAVLVFTNLAPWSILRAGVRLYHNPWAKFPYMSDCVILPQAIPLPDGKMKLENGVSLASIFGLSDNWPTIDDDKKEQDSSKE